MSVSEQDLLAPTNAVSRHYGQYLDEMNAWGSDTRPIMMIVHANGDNVVTYEAVDLFFRTIEEIRATSNYQQVCQHSSSKDLFTEEPECGINGITEFWYHNRTLFQQETQGSDQLTREYLSKDELPDGSPAFPHFMLGYYQRNETTGLIDYAKSIAGTLNFPKDLPGGLSDSFESDVIQNLQNAQDKWENNSNSSPDKKHSYEMEFLTLRSMADELVRAIYKDLPLVPLVFIIMALFCCVVFYRHDRVQSRTLLGLGSVVTILMSIMTGYGLLFCVGVPFTNMTQILPFVIFGIGLGESYYTTRITTSQCLLTN